MSDPQAVLDLLDMHERLIHVTRRMAMERLDEQQHQRQRQQQQQQQQPPPSLQAYENDQSRPSDPESLHGHLPFPAPISIFAQAELDQLIIPQAENDQKEDSEQHITLQAENDQNKESSKQHIDSTSDLFSQQLPELVFTQAELDQLAIDLAKGDLAKDEHEGHEKQQGGIKRSADEAEIEESDGSESGPRKKTTQQQTVPAYFIDTINPALLRW